MADWQYSASGPMRMAGDADCVCAVCGTEEGRGHPPDCPIGQAFSDLARVTAERDRLRAALEYFAEQDCYYGDGCPAFGSRHGQCSGCKAREALRAVE